MYKERFDRKAKTISFTICSASTHMMEILLHKEGLLDPGAGLKHEWFKSKKISEKLDFDFPKKEKILNLLKLIQEKRNDLCYGSPRTEEEILEFINKFNELKEIMESFGVRNEE